MKKYIFILFTALLATVAISCEKTSAGTTEIINYFQVNGASAMYLGVGEQFEDPGYVELEGGGTVSTAIYDMDGNEVSAVTTDEPGFFSIYYTATNDQGYTLNKKRMVYIYDDTVSETLGTFTVDLDNSYRQSTPYALYFSNYGGADKVTITFKQVAGNIYSCPCLLGGFWQYMGAYASYVESGYDFTMKGYITLNADMSISLLSSSCEAFGDSLEGLEGQYEPTEKTLTFIADYGYTSSGAHDVYTVVMKGDK